MQAHANQHKNNKLTSTRMGFEPTRAEPIGLAVQRLNHSATSSLMEKGQQMLKYFPTPGVEPGPPG